MANHQTNFTSNFGEMGETGNAAFVLNVNGTSHTYHPIGSDVSVDVATVHRILATEPNLAQTIAAVLAAGGYPVLVYDGSEYGYIRTANNRYVFTCIDSINVVKQAEVDTQDGTITAGASGVGGVSILARNESDLFLKITTALTLGKAPIILDNGAYYHLVAKTGTLAQFARDTSSGTLQVLSVDNNNQTTLSTFTFLESTGDASNTTSTFTKASGDTSTMTSGSKLSVIFSAISSFFASVLSALNNAKTKQTAVTDPTADGTGLSFIDSITQNTNGEITPHKKTVQDGTTSQKGVVQLQDSIGSTESTIDKAATPHAVREAINAAVSAAYHAAGTKTVAQLTGSLLVAGNNGSVYNITDSGTTTSDFVDGAGHPINAGDNVGVCDVGGGVYKFDLLSGFVDLSNYLAKTGDASNATSTLTKNASDTSSMTSGSKLSVLFTAISNFFASLKALAFKDTVGTSDIADDAITAAKVKDNETLPVNVSGTATHLSAYGEWNTWNGTYVESTPFALIGEQTWPLTNNNGDGSVFQFEWNNNLIVRLKLCIITSGSTIARTEAIFLGGTANLTDVRDHIRITYFTYTSNNTQYITVRIYVKFTGNWQNWRIRQLDCQTADNGYLNWRSFNLRSGKGSDQSSTVGTPVTYSFKTPFASGQVGDPSTSVYVDSNGQVRPCTPSSMSVGHASALTPGGNAGQVLMSNGSGTDPSWATIANAVWYVFQNIPSVRANAVPIANFEGWCSVLAYVDSAAQLRLFVSELGMDDYHQLTVSYSTGIQTSPTLTYGDDWDIPVSFINGVGQFHKIRLMEGSQILDLEVQFRAEGQNNYLYVRK